MKINMIVAIDSFNGIGKDNIPVLVQDTKQSFPLA